MNKEHNEIQQSPVQQVMFFPSLFNETVKLLTDAHDYFSNYSRLDQKHASAPVKLLYSSEMSRITIRLSSVMAWLLARRAVLSGDISEQDAINHHALEARELCLRNHPQIESVLPEYVRYLLDESLGLYERVARLHDQIAEQTKLAPTLQ